MLVLCTGCACPKASQSVRESVHVIEHTQLVPVVAEYNFPELTSERDTRDTTSHLENRYAESDAIISKGILHHTLLTKPQTIQVPTTAVIQYRDSIVYRDREVIVEKEVEAPLRGWNKLRCKAFWFLLVIALVGWRRELWKLIKLIIHV